MGGGIDVLEKHAVHGRRDGSNHASPRAVSELLGARQLPVAGNEVHQQRVELSCADDENVGSGLSRVISPIAIRTSLLVSPAPSAHARSAQQPGADEEQRGGFRYDVWAANLGQEPSNLSSLER